MNQTANGPFAAKRSRGTNRQTGEQMTHWDMLHKATKFEFSLFNMSQCVTCFLHHVTGQLQRADCSLFLWLSGLYRLSPAYYVDKRCSILFALQEVCSENRKQGNGGK